jgi:hypothetical protein
MIHECDDGTYCISSHRVWMPGVYESKKAARYAFQFDEAILRRLQNESGEGVITLEALKMAKSESDALKNERRARSVNGG